MAIASHVQQAAALPPCDINKRYVRICERRDGFVMFEFSIGWEELVVELMLPPQAFDAFCAANRVVMLQPRRQTP